MIVVNPNTRQFSIPGADLVFGVEADSGSEVKHFQCPSFVGNNLEVANTFIRINYRNANGETDSYLVDDVTVDGDNVHFSWLLAPKVTAYKGQVKFVMCVVGPDLKVKWHTAMGTGQVHEGLEPDQSHIEDETDDVVAALIAMVEQQTAAVEAVGKTWVDNTRNEGVSQVAAVKAAAQAAQSASVAEIEAKGVNTRNSIPSDYTALSKAVDDLTRDRAGAIVCEAEGSAVTLGDASNSGVMGLRIFGRSTQDGVPTPTAPVEIKSVENPTVRVFGKNLLQPKYEVGMHTINGLKFTVGTDGSVTLNGTPTASAGFVFETLYVHEPVILTGCPAGGTTRTYRMTADCYKNNEFVETTFDLGDGLKITPDMADYVNINVFAFAGTNFNNLTFRPMVRLAIDPYLAYELYKPVQTISTAHTLHGIPVTTGGNYTDENGQQWICDEVDLERGVYVQRIGHRAFDGTETAWRRGTMPTGEPMNYVYFSDYAVENLNLSLCSHSVFAAGGGYWNNGGYMRSGTGYWQTLTDMALDEWKAYLSEQNANGTPLVVCYVLSKPIETPLSETEIAAYRALHTNKPNTTILNDSGAHMKVEYAADTKLYIDQRIKGALL